MKKHVLFFCVRIRLLILLLMWAPVLGMAQNITVKGKVQARDGQPVASASVTVKGTSGGTVTDDEGNFVINVSPNAVLVISAVNFQTQEIAVSNRNTLTVWLNPDEKNLDAVVVVGYGTQRKRDVTGAIVSVSEKALREVPVANLQQALQGRAAGLEVQRVGNQPGAGAQIRIRGNRSITGSNEPLIVVDNIPWDGNLNDINPDDVASVEILKDASATAIYGSRGANGVILVSTKKGRSGETTVSYNGYYGIGQVANPFPVFDATEYQAMRNISPWGGGYMPEELRGIQLGRNTNWQELLYKNSIRTDHNITVAGGHSGNNFSLGGGYFKETTVLPGEEFNRYTLRATIDSRVGKIIKVGVNTQNSLIIQHGAQFVSGRPLFSLLALSPLMPPYDSTGAIYLRPWGNVDDNNAADRYNPLFLKRNNNNWVDRIRRLRTFNTLYGEIEFFKGLKYRLNLGLNYVQQHSAQFQGADNPPNNPSYFRAGQGNIASVDNGETWGYTAENLLYYDNVFKGVHKLGATLLYSIQESQSYNNFVRKDSITEDFVQFYNLALSTPITGANTSLGGNESRWALLSYMARVNYAYDNKYLLTVTFRRDGSSRLAKGNKWFNYPAVSAGWVISDEKFFSNVKNVSQLKLRAGWGQTSNQAINPYESLGLVSNSNGLAAGSTGGNIIRYNYGPTIVTGYNVVTLPNPGLSWEFTSTTNIGLDFSLFKNRITGTMEYYNSATDKVLYSVTLPVTSGVAGAFLTNVGKITNKGFELTLTTENINTRSGFNWSTDINLFFNKNKIIRLSSGIKQDVGNQLFVGHSMTAIYDYKKLGIWQISEAAQAAAFGSVPGQIKLQDYSGPDGKPDGRITELHDRYVIGDQDADLQGGMTHRITYKGFDFSTVIYARFGGLLISQIHQPFASYLTVLDGRRNGLKVDYWTPTNPTNWFPRPQASFSNISTAWTTLGYYSGTFVKIRSVNFGYTFNRSVLRYLKARSARVYFTIDNLATLFSPYFRQTGIDPEGTGVGNQGVSNPGNIRNNARGNGAITIGLGTPPRRTYTFGVNLTL
ncbi:MAG: TonB-dependent receptor [Chitinophagaceae bacterium]|nr:TonB-dependent receptor [Chitinophagaceae bacterium]